MRLGAKAAAITAAAFALQACARQPERLVDARVEAILPDPNPKVYPVYLTIVYRSVDGAIGKTEVLKSRLNCQVGDTVRARQRGVALSVDENACAR